MVLPDVDVLFLDWHITLSKGLFFSTNNENPTEGFSPKLELINACIFDNTALVRDWMRGKTDYISVLESASNTLGLNSKEVINQAKLSCLGIDFDIPKTREVITRIRESGTKVVLASDNMDIFRLVVVPNLQLDTLFDALLLSNELGVLKTDINHDSIPFFDPFLKQHQTSYQKAVLIDDSGHKVEEYHKQGFPRIKVESSKETLDLLQKMV